MNEQQELGITVESAPRADREMVDGYRFEPIRGQPMLRWAGKRPFTSTQYFPAQEKERHGDETDGWMNELYWGDNLQVMSHLLKKYRGRVNLIYIDPPFDSKADYKKTIALRGQKVENDHNSFEEKQYTDIWTNDEYLQFMYERLILCRELLADTGSIYIHLDWHVGHYIKWHLYFTGMLTSDKTDFRITYIDPESNAQERVPPMRYLPPLRRRLGSASICRSIRCERRADISATASQWSRRAG